VFNLEELRIKNQVKLGHLAFHCPNGFENRFFLINSCFRGCFLLHLRFQAVTLAVNLFVKKAAAIILASTFALAQLLSCGLDYYKTIVHAICYHDFLVSNDNADKTGLVVSTDLVTYQNARKDEYELLWKGELYDIVKKQVKGNTITVTLKKDINENSLLNSLKTIQEQLNKASHPDSPTNSSFFQWVFKVYIPEATHSQPPLRVSLAVQYNLLLTHFPPAFYPEGPCQPPDSSC